MIGRGIGELHEIAEILDRAVAAALVEIVHEGRAVIGREHRRVAADLARCARGCARAGCSAAASSRRACAPARLGKRTRSPLTSAPGLPRSARARRDNRGTRRRFPAAGSRRCASMSGEPLLAEDLGQGNGAGDVGHGGGAATRARRPARLAAAPRLGGGGFRRCVHRASPFVLGLGRPNLRLSRQEMNSQNALAAKRQAWRRSDQTACADRSAVDPWAATKPSTCGPGALLAPGFQAARTRPAA